MDYSEKIKEGKLFIYPTDTIYGIGCDATNVLAVNSIKELKGRDADKPLSVIAPSLEWIKNYLIVDCNLEDYFPGPYTLILKKQDPEFLKHVASGDSLGVRIPACEFTQQIKLAKVPFITTSVNLSGKPFAISIKEINGEILNKVDIVIDVGELNGRPSTLVVNGKEVKR